jgi:hypothetical protein
MGHSRRWIVRAEVSAIHDDAAGRAAAAAAAAAAVAVAAGVTRSLASVAGGQPRRWGCLAASGVLDSAGADHGALAEILSEIVRLAEILSEIVRPEKGA